MDVEQRVGLGASTPPASPPGRTGFGRPGRRRGRVARPISTATKPTVAHMSSRHACTAASARNPSWRIASTSGRDTSTNASRPSERISRLSLRGNELRAQRARPSAPRSSSHGSSSTARRREVGEDAIGDRVDERVLVADPAVQRDGRDAEPRRDAAHAHRVEPRLAEDVDRGGDDLVGVEIEVGSSSHGSPLTGPSPACRRPAVGEALERGRAARRTWASAVTALLQPAVGDERRQAARGSSSSSAGDWPPANTPTSEAFATTRSCAAIFGHRPAGEADGRCRPSRASAPAASSAIVAADRVVDHVDAAAVGRGAQRGRRAARRGA